MNKKILFFFCLLVLVLISCTGENDSKENISDSRGKIYYWSIDIWVCKVCSPYQREEVPQKDIDKASQELISSFEKGEVILVEAGGNKIVLNLTHEAKDKLLAVLDSKNSSFSGVKIFTIINWSPLP